MLIKTHFAIIVCAILIFLSAVESKVVFVIVALIATFLPDIDSQFSSVGKKKILRPLQFFIKHRGIIHSFSFLILLTLFFVLFIPVVALGFFLGYGLHLFVDSFTVDGIRPFYPSRKKASGKLRVGGKVETLVFIVFILIDLVLLILKLSSIF